MAETREICRFEGDLSGQGKSYNVEKTVRCIMKIFIWVVCFVIAAVLMGFLSVGGHGVGAIPAGLIIGGAISLAIWLCKKWDYR